MQALSCLHSPPIRCFEPRYMAMHMVPDKVTCHLVNLSACVTRPRSIDRTLLTAPQSRTYDLHLSLSVGSSVLFRCRARQRSGFPEGCKHPEIRFQDRIAAPQEHFRRSLSKRDSNLSQRLTAILSSCRNQVFGRAAFVLLLVSTDRSKGQAGPGSHNNRCIFHFHPTNSTIQPKDA